MSIVKPYTFVAGNKARANEVNEDFDILYQQVNANITNIADVEGDIQTLSSTKANVNGDSTQRFAVADPVSSGDAVNKRTLFKQIANSIDYIGGLTISKDSGSPNDTILIDPGACYDSTKEVVLKLDVLTTKQNTPQSANTAYYVYIIGNATGSSVDILISTEPNVPALPTGYTRYRKIGGYTTNSNGYIDGIFYYGINSNTNKSSSASFNWMLPDHTARISFAKNTDYTCPSNGWAIVFLKSVESGGNGTISINGISYTTNTSSGNYVDSCLVTMAVSRNDVVRVSSAQTPTCYFAPCKGENQ